MVQERVTKQVLVSFQDTDFTKMGGN